MLEHVMLLVNSWTVKMIDAHYQFVNPLYPCSSKKIRKRNSNAPQTICSRQEVTKTQRYWREKNIAFVSPPVNTKTIILGKT